MSWEDKRKGLLILSVLSFGIFLYYFYSFYNHEYLFEAKNLIKIDNLVISEKPKLEVIKPNKSPKYELILFKIKGFEKTFELTEDKILCNDKLYLLNGLNTNDTVSIIVNRSEIDKLKTISFFNKTNEIISIQKNYSNGIATDLKCVETKNLKNLEFGLKVSLMFSFLTLITYLVKKQPQLFGINIDLTIFIAILMLIFLIIIR